MIMMTSAGVGGHPHQRIVGGRHFWPGEEPIGKRLVLTFFPDVVRASRGSCGRCQARRFGPGSTFYNSVHAFRPGFGARNPEAGILPSMILLVCSATNPDRYVSAVENAVHEVDREIPVRDILTMDELVTNSMSQQRFNMLLLGAFAGLALLLAAIGIYSVLSYSVKRRVQEIGIRLALGARIGDVLRIVLFDSMKPTLLGLALGTAGALAMGQVLPSP